MKKPVTELEAARIKQAYDEACAWLDAHPQIPRKFAIGPPQQIDRKTFEAQQRELKKMKQLAKDLEPKKKFKRRRR